MAFIDPVDMRLIKKLSNCIYSFWLKFEFNKSAITFVAFKKDPKAEVAEKK